MQTSELINEISAALAKAQGKMENPDKGSVNPHYKTNYADLASGINAVRAALAENGLSIVQTTCLDGELLTLKTRLCHASGQWMEGSYPVCKFPTPPQQIGSAMTYARRYSMFAIVGIAPEDDDGDATRNTEVPPGKKTRNDPPPAPPAYDDFPGDMPSQNEGRAEAREYVKLAIQVIEAWSGNVIALKQWWDDEKIHRDANGVVNPSPEYAELFEVFKTRGMAIAGHIKSKRAA